MPGHFNLIVFVIYLTSDCKINSKNRLPMPNTVEKVVSHINLGKLLGNYFVCGFLWVSMVGKSSFSYLLDIKPKKYPQKWIPCAKKPLKSGITHDSRPII